MERSEQKTPEPEEIRRDIAETREELGETVEALAQKADVKGQAKTKVAEKQQEAKAKLGEAREKVSGVTPDQAKQSAAQVAERARERPVPATAAGAFAAGLVVGWLLGRR
jgi:ElaB/YqjD/DUF883 family membrane-anchored ribosome-binding protein